MFAVAPTESFGVVEIVAVVGLYLGKLGLVSRVEKAMTDPEDCR